MLLADACSAAAPRPHMTCLPFTTRGKPAAVSVEPLTNKAHQGERKSQNHTLWHVRSVRGSAGGRWQRMCQLKKRFGYARVKGANAVSSFLTPTPPAKFTSIISVVAASCTQTTM